MRIKKKMIKFVAMTVMLAVPFIPSIKSNAQVDIYKPVGADETAVTDEKTEQTETAEEKDDIASEETQLDVLQDIRVMLLGILVTTGFTAGATMAQGNGVFRHDR